MTDKKPGRKLIPADPALDEAELAAMKAIKSYETVEKKLMLFESEHAAVFETFDEMLGELELKRQVADATIRPLDASFGPWQRLSEQRTYDVTALYSLVGDERFRDLGGTVSEMPVYELDKDTLKVAIAAKKIPPSVVDAILKITPKYRAPKPRLRP